MKKSLLLLVLLLVFLCIASGGWASMIYIDEDFEGATPFADQGWAVVYGGDNDAGPVTADRVAVQGICLAHEDGSDLNKFAFTNEGTVDPSRSFAPGGGSKSLRLASGQKVQAGAPIVGADEDSSFFQFAISATASDLAGLTTGTQIGHFRIDYTTNALDDGTAEVSYLLLFKVGQGGSLDVVSGRTGATLASIDIGDAGHPWGLVSLVPVPGTATRDWGALDPLTGVKKGPVKPSQTNATRTAILPAGFSLFVSSKTVTETTSRGQFDPSGAWGGANTAVIGWELGADNGGVLYIDNLMWSACPDTMADTSYMDRDISARMLEFDAGAPVPAEARSWTLY